MAPDAGRARTRAAVAPHEPGPGGGDLPSATGTCAASTARRAIKVKQATPAQQELGAAVTAFRAAAELRPNWPDPFLGLMRTFIVMEDIERGRRRAGAGAALRLHRGQSRLGAARRGLSRPRREARRQRGARDADARRRGLHAGHRQPVEGRRLRQRHPAAARGTAPPGGSAGQDRRELSIAGRRQRSGGMSVTYTSAADRDRRRSTRAFWPAAPEPLLTAASLRCRSARSRSPTPAASACSANPIAAAAVVNLNTARDAAALEPALAAVFANPAERTVRRRSPVSVLQHRRRGPARAAERRRHFARHRQRRRDSASQGSRGARRPRRSRSRRPDRARSALHRGRPRQAEAVPHRAYAPTSSGAWCWRLAALYIAGFHAVALLWSRATYPRRSPAARDGAPPDRRRLRRAPEPAGSAA